MLVLLFYLCSTILMVPNVFGKPFRANTCGYDACPKTDPNGINVHIVSHSHDDVGWLKTVDQYYFQDVENVLNSVVDALNANPNRTYIQVETAFFKKWWEQQSENRKQNFIDLLNQGRVEMINGAWSMNDEAAVHYQSTIDQFTLGLRYLEDNLGPCSRPRVAWQIDPFGHSREQASLAAQFGFDSFFFARLDYRDQAKRYEEKSPDLLWRGSQSLGNTSDIFTSILYDGYGSPPNFCFNIGCNDEVLILDEDSPDYNWERRVNEFADYARTGVANYPTNNLLVTSGTDFQYQAAMKPYMNWDKIIEGFERFQIKDVKVFYSTPSCYAKAVNEYANANDYHLDLKTDDFFPYGEPVTSLWTGYFTSRPASKRFERLASSLVQVVKQLAVVTTQSYYNTEITALREAMGILQHHDAITGTEKQAVADDYHRLLNAAIEGTSTFTDTALSSIVGGEVTANFRTCLLANVSLCDQSQTDQFSIIVYNPLSRVVSNPIDVPVNTVNWVVIDPDGNTIPNQVTPAISDFSYISDAQPSPYTLTFFAKDLPPMGFKLYTVASAEELSIPDSKASSKIGNEATSFEIDEESGLLKTVTMNGVTLEVTQDFLYYKSKDSSGAYLFDPTEDGPQRIAESSVKVTPFSGDVYQGVVQEFSGWAKQIIKVYNDDPNYIEFDWLIGPLDISDGVGKEIISRFTTSLETEGTFYTDANGREMIQRIKDYRPTYNYTNESPVAGNYYPVNTRIVIKDEQQGLELAILTDRSEGGSSLENGQLELMIHRACQHDDSRGVGENLNEQEYGQGIVIRGQHHLVLGPTSGNGDKTLATLQRELAQAKHLGPWAFLSTTDTTFDRRSFSMLKEALPSNVQILTLEPWNEDTVLLRLEHILEKGDDPNLSQDVTVDLSDIFEHISIQELQETTLAGNVPLDRSSRLHWPGSEELEGQSPVLDVFGRDVKDLSITLAPMQIRTFLANISYQ